MSIQNSTLHGPVLKTPVHIVAESLTDVMGEPISYHEQVQLILQIISNKIAVTTINEHGYSYEKYYNKLTIKPSPSKEEITIIDSSYTRRFKISSFSSEWLKAWFLSVADRPWPFSRIRADEHREKILFDFSEEETPNFNDCTICMHKKAHIMLVPCKHVCVCESCVVKLEICPVCRQKINRWQNVEIKSKPELAKMGAFLAAPYFVQLH